MAAARGEGSPERTEQGQVRRDTVDAARNSGVGECVPVSSWRGAHGRPAGVVHGRLIAATPERRSVGRPWLNRKLLLPLRRPWW